MFLRCLLSSCGGQKKHTSNKVRSRLNSLKDSERLEGVNTWREEKEREIKCVASDEDRFASRAAFSTGWLVG